MLLSAALILSSLAAADLSPAVPEPPAHQALVEVEILRLDPAGATQKRPSIAIYELDQADYHRSLELLATLKDQPATLAESGEPPRVGIPGIGLFEGGQLLTSPRVIAQERQPAAIQTGANQVDRQIDLDRPGHPSTAPAPSPDSLISPIRLGMEWIWESEAHTQAHLWITLTLPFEEGDLRWEGELILEDGESGIVTIPRGHELFAVVLKFRPLTVEFSGVDLETDE